MRRAGGISALMLWASMGMAAEEAIILPSGLVATPFEVLWNRTGNGLVYRYRFVAPDFTTEGQDFDQMMQDLEFLCNEYALSHLAKPGPQPKQLIISLASRELEFGVVDPAVTQVFEAYRVENDTCIWEVY